MASIFTSDELRDLAARASTINERLAGGYGTVESPESATTAARRLEAWCKTATDGDLELFRTHLTQDGFTIGLVKPLLGEVRLSPEQPTPAWTETFHWIVDAMGSPTPRGAPCGFTDPDQPLPFEDLFVPLVIAAGQRPELTQGLDTALFTASARAGLQLGLLRRLTELCAPTLHQGFTLFQMRERRAEHPATAAQCAGP